MVKSRKVVLIGREKADLADADVAVDYVEVVFTTLPPALLQE
jgi:hypothetical protein